MSTLMQRRATLAMTLLAAWGLGAFAACGEDAGSAQADAGAADNSVLPDDGSSDSSSVDARADGSAPDAGDSDAGAVDGDGGPVNDADAAAGDSNADAATDAIDDGDALLGPECPTSDPAPPVVAATTSVSFIVTNSSSADRWLLTMSTDCEDFSIDGVVKMPPQQSNCQNGEAGVIPPEQLFFQRLAPGASATLTWDGRGVVGYTTYQSCWPNMPFCLASPQGSLEPTDAGQYVAVFGVSSGLTTGNGTPCTSFASGDVGCVIAPPSGAPQRGGQCVWANTTMLRQGFTLPATGSLSVNVSIP